MPAAGAKAEEEEALLPSRRLSRRVQPAATLEKDSSGEEPWPDILEVMRDE